jgi:two-component system sensor histidine kinase ResE
MKINFLNHPQDDNPSGNDNKDHLSHAFGIKNTDFENSQDEFLSIASHELRTPLTVIKGNTSLIQQYFWQQMPSDEVRQMIKDIEHSSDRMLKLINSFLDTLRLEQKLVKIEFEKIDVTQILSAIVSDYQEHKKHDVHLMFKNSNATLPQALTDKKWLKHAVENLLDNALKFTARGNVTVSVDSDGSNLKILVSDTGQGIPQSVQQIIFKKFAQSNEDLLTRDTLQGAGLGLYMTQLIMENLNGNVQLEHSEPGVGSVFSLSIPLVP